MRAANPPGVADEKRSAEDIVINRTESRLIALERRNQAQRSAKGERAETRAPAPVRGQARRAGDPTGGRTASAG